MRVRIATINRLLDACYGYHDRYFAAWKNPGYVGPRLICRGSSREDKARLGDATLSGSFILSLAEIGLSPTREHSNDVKRSIN